MFVGSRASTSARFLLPLLLAGGCGGNNTSSQVQPPGAPATPKTRVLEGGAALLQEKAPVGALNVYVDGFHFYNGNLDIQVEAHHYCSIVNEDVRQCVIFDGNGADAKLMGIEYIVSRRVFESLPADERKLWHSHVYEVRSGTLIAPGIPDTAEQELMEGMVDTYGKTWHTWHADQGHALPTGHPLLMAGFTADGQIHPDMIASRDARFSVSTEDERRLRADLPEPTIVDGADAWQTGEALQLTLQARQVPAAPARSEPEAGRSNSSAEPTRRIRGTKVQPLYAALPPRGADH